MKQDQFKQELSSLTDQELQWEIKKRRTRWYTAAVMIGVLVGVSVYGAVRHGLSFFTVLPLLLIPTFIGGDKLYKEALAEQKSRVR